MQKAFDLIVERLEERMDRPYRRISIQTVIEIVNKVAEEYKSTEHINCSSDDLIYRKDVIYKMWDKYNSEYNDASKYSEEETMFASKVISDMQRIINDITVQVNDGWIPCSSGKMPMEHDSIFANYKGTRKWNDCMFEKISDEVNVTVADENGNGTTTHAHTVDGKWECDLLKCNKTYKVIAWQPLPQPYKPK